MNQYYKNYNTIEDFIFDNSFAALARINNQDEINELLSLYPDKQDIMKNAIVLLQYIKITAPYVPDEQIDEDWNNILQLIDKKKQSKKNKRIYIWATSAVAVCASIIFLILLYPQQNNTEKQHLLSLVESANLETNEIQIIAGDNQANIKNNETIIQTKEGSLVVGKSEKINSKNIKTEYLTVVVPKGRRTIVKLNDGTTIWVNSDTKVVYPKTFNNEYREIMIEGEAYINVAKNEIKPFIVHTQSFDVRVLGTEFNISAYKNDPAKSVVLVKGSVEITTESLSKGVLIPHQGFFTENDSFYIKNVDIYPYVCWKDGVMQLNGESLDVIMKKLSRYYGVDIQTNKRFALEKYKGKIDLKDPIETILNNISLSTPISYTKEGDVIYIK